MLITLTAWMGCAHRVDWNARVGLYTYDQAVLELGPPERSATLTDNRLVCEWRVMQGTKTLMLYGGAGYGWGYRPAGGWYVPVGPVFATESPNPDRVLRLIFSAEMVLENWQLVYK
jgi:hypothetical protein